MNSRKTFFVSAFVCLASSFAACGGSPPICPISFCTDAGVVTPPNLTTQDAQACTLFTNGPVIDVPLGSGGGASPAVTADGKAYRLHFGLKYVGTTISGYTAGANLTLASKGRFAVYLDAPVSFQVGGYVGSTMGPFLPMYETSSITACSAVKSRAVYSFGDGQTTLELFDKTIQQSTLVIIPVP